MERKDRDNSKEEQQIPTIAVGRKPTRENLEKALETVRNAAEHGVVAEITDQDIAEAPMAFEAFMGRLNAVLARYADSLKVTELEGWMKIEGPQGHKIYITKTKTVVNRVESTLDPDLIKGAEASTGNGRIASVLPATTKAVAEAVRLLATLKEAIRPPARGAQQVKE